MDKHLFPGDLIGGQLNKVDGVKGGDGDNGNNEVDGVFGRYIDDIKASCRSRRAKWSLNSHTKYWDTKLPGNEALEKLQDLLGFINSLIPMDTSLSWADLRPHPKLYELILLAEESRTNVGRIALFVSQDQKGNDLAEQVLAKQLGRPLYRVYLEAVNSQFTGETKENLDRMFEFGKKLGAILLFDEADHLFGKGGEVSDVHVRYPNLDTKDLLRRIEEYPGLVILTSNARATVEETLVGRAKWVIEFCPPLQEKGSL